VAKQHPSVPPPSQIVIADDHPFFLSGLRDFLERSDSFDVVAEATDGQQALELTRTLKPDLVLMDVRMPRIGVLRPPTP